MNLLVPYDLNSTEEDTSFRRTITHRRSIDSNSYNKSRHIDDDRNNICISDVSSNANDHLMESSLSPIHVNNDSDVEFNESTNQFKIYIDNEFIAEFPSNFSLAKLTLDFQIDKKIYTVQLISVNHDGYCQIQFEGTIVSPRKMK